MRYYNVDFFIEGELPQDEELNLIFSLLGGIFGFDSAEYHEVGVFFVIERTIDTNKQNLEEAIEITKQMIRDKLNAEIDMDKKFPYGWDIIHEVKPFIGRDM